MGAGIYYASSNKVTKHSIISLLSSENRQLLTKGQNPEKWKPLWTSFKNKYKTGNITTPVAPWDFSNWNSLKNEDNAPADFQNKCINNSKGEVESVNDELYQTIKTYCTEEKTKPATANKQSIKNILNNSGKKILEKTEDNKSKWNSNWSKFKDNYETLKSSSLWTFTDWESKHKSVDEAPDEFKNKCETNANEEVINDTDKLYTEIVQYCTDGN